MCKTWVVSNKQLFFFFFFSSPCFCYYNDIFLKGDFQIHFFYRKCPVVNVLSVDSMQVIFISILIQAFFFFFFNINVRRSTTAPLTTHLLVLPFCSYPALYSILTYYVVFYIYRLTIFPSISEQYIFLVNKMYGNFHCPPSYCYDLLPTFMGVKVPLQWRLKKGKKKVSHYVDSPAIKAFLFFQHRTDCV